MYPVTVTSDAQQTQTLILPDGSEISLTMSFVPMQQGWFITNISWQSFDLNGLRISNSPNMLQQFRNQLTWGLACYSPPANREPSQQQDFSSGASNLYVLSQAEVEAYNTFITTGAWPS